MTRTQAIAHVIASVILACAFAFLALCFIVGLMSIWAFVAFFVVIIAALLWPLTDLEIRPSRSLHTPSPWPERTLAEGQQSSTAPAAPPHFS